jgi:hypothetical protein
MKIRNSLLALSLGLTLAGTVGAQVISYSPRTGDVWIDSELGYMNDYGRRDRDYFVDDVVGSFGAPRYLVNDLLTTKRWDPGDVYYACALAYQLRRPCADVVRTREQNRGQGWGVIAQRMGIKPGSAEFHALKGQVGKSNGKFRGHGPGNSGKHDGAIDSGPGNSGDKGNSGKPKGKPAAAEDHGNSGNSGNAEAKGNGKAKGKP